MTSGMTDDFFGSWAPDKEKTDSDAFNPDEIKISIFDLP